MYELVEPACVEALREAVSQAAQAGTTATCEIELRDPDTVDRFYQLHVAPAVGDTGLIGVALIGSDTTERRRAERALQRHAELDQVLAMVSSEFINLGEDEVNEGVDRALETLGTVCEADRGFLFLCRDNAETLDHAHEWSAWGTEPKKQGSTTLPPRAFPWWREKLTRLETIRIPRAAELPPEADGERCFLERYGVRSFLAAPMVLGGRLYGFLGLAWTRGEGRWSEDEIALLRAVGEVFTGALERAGAARELRKARDELELRVQERTGELQRLSAQLVSAQEAERKRISRELHDEMGQALTAISINLAAISRDQSSQLSSDSVARLSESGLLAEETLERMRELILELRPSLLDDLGLVPTLRWYANRFAKRVGTEVEVEVDGLDERLPAPVETAMYRVVQEALTNVARHAEATRVHLRLERTANAIIAVIEDDGRGFETACSGDAPGSTGGTGLVGVRERLSPLGGSVQIHSQAGEGTRLSVTIPVPRTDRDTE
jgi:signal transduction histidine kinase